MEKRGRLRQEREKDARESSWKKPEGPQLRHWIARLAASSRFQAARRYRRPPGTSTVKPVATGTAYGMVRAACPENRHRSADIPAAPPHSELPPAHLHYRAAT